MTGRIVRSADFERVLGTPSRARSAHFAVHHLAANPSQPKRPASAGVRTGLAVGLCTAQGDLSTGDALNHPQLVDECAQTPIAQTEPTAAPAAAQALPEQPSAPTGSWLGYVVPKRHARRAVTRTLLKRQIRQVFGTLPTLPPGLWVVRLRLPFDRKQFISASSDALRAAAREELLQLIRKVTAKSSEKSPRPAAEKPASKGANAAPAAGPASAADAAGTA